MSPFKIAVHGAAGRMGQRVIALAAADESIRVTQALESANSPALGKDAGTVAGIEPLGVDIAPELTDQVDVVIDFSVPEASVAIAAVCEDRRIPLVVASTGFTEAQRRQILSASQTTALVIAPSMSVAVNLVMKLAAEAARTLKSQTSGVDVEIIERHHRFKEDAPSGTALRFGEIIAAEMGQTEHVHGRKGRTGIRPQSEIGYHALRTGDNVGEHTIVFGLMGETIELTVRGHTRDSYAYGAIAAAKFAAGQGAGLYSMADVLGFDT